VSPNQAKLFGYCVPRVNIVCIDTVMSLPICWSMFARAD
jgi:hypothetical protein